MRGLGALLGMVVSVWLLSNCQSIVGIKDYTYVAENPECANYCDLAQANCGGGDSGNYSSIYTNRETCKAVCNQFDPNQPQTVGFNSLGCRQTLLRGMEPMDCPKAGPGGGKPPNDSCGTNCDSYCSLYRKICPTQFNKEFGSDSGAPCADACNALPDTGGYNVASDDTGATLQCRFFHLSAAAAGIDSPECSQVGLRPSDQCTDAPGSDAFCSNFCTYAINACPGSLAVYENKTQCFNVCKALPPGTDKNDTLQNTMICRSYHISNVLLISRAQHCPHLGPGGDGHCGTDDLVAMTTGNCESYCLLREKACPESQATPRAQCEQECRNVSGAPANSGYTVNPPLDAGATPGAPLPGTLQCRLLHLARALEHPDMRATDCLAADGGGECAVPAN